MYKFERGETIIIPLLLVQGEKTQVSGMRANLKKAGPNGSVPAESSPIAGSFSVSESDQGWTLTLDANLDVGLYVVNAAFEVGSATIITKPLNIKIEPSTTI